MQIKNHIKKRQSLKIIAYIVTVIWCIFIIAPVLYLFSSSMKDDLQIYDTPPTFLPRPPVSIGVVVDYSDMLEKGEESLKESVLKDSTLAMYSIAYEINKSGVFNIEFYGTVKDKIIYKASATKLDLHLNRTYLVYDKARVSRENLLEKYAKSVEILGYEFSLDGLKESLQFQKLGTSNFDAEIREFLKNKYGVEGNITGSIETKSYWYALKNYAGYWKVPTVVFSKDRVIAKFSFLWFGFNTVVIALFAILAQVIISSLAGYALSRLFGSRLSKILLLFILSASMIPFVSYMIPMYVMFQQLRLSDSYLGLMIPHLTAAGFFVYLYKGFIDMLPKDLFEAARIDGAGEMRSYFTICMALSKPVTAVIAINTALGVWNDFFWPYLIAKKQSLWTLNVALYNLSGNADIKQNFIMGLAALSIIPLLVVVAVFGDNLKKGMVFSGIKG